MSTRSVVCLLTALLWTTPAAAQSDPEDDPAPVPRVQVLPRFTASLSVSHLVSDDERYVWDAEYGAEIDLVDYATGRTSIYATYHVGLGEAFQPFDPYQGNYLLGATSSWRVGRTEVSGVFHHVSRHLGDRVRPTPVDWNMIGVRAARSLARRRLTIEPIVDIRGVIQRTSVDYRWEMDGRVRGTYQVRTDLAWLATGSLRVLGVDGTRHRGTQTGVRGETGLRLEGRRAAVELFIAAERRVDPSPLEFGTVNWVSTGFRLVTR